MPSRNDGRVQEALDSFQAAAVSHAGWQTHDPVVRQAYRALIRKLSQRIWDRYQAGNMTADEAAQAAMEGRNFILEVSRVVSTPAGRDAAMALKAGGRTFDSLKEGYAQKLFKRPFAELDSPEQGTVFEGVIQAAGRSRPSVDAEMRALGASSRLFWVLTILMATYDIASARDKVAAAVHDVAVLGGAIVTGEIFGGTIGSFGGPLGTGFGVVVGGILGGWLVDHFAYHDADPALTGE